MVKNGKSEGFWSKIDIFWLVTPIMLIALHHPIDCNLAMKNTFKWGTAIVSTVLRFCFISEKPHFLAKNGTFWLITLVTLFAPHSPISHNFYMQNAFKWGMSLLCSVLRFPISCFSKGHVHCVMSMSKSYGPWFAWLVNYWITPL